MAKFHDQAQPAECQKLPMSDDGSASATMFAMRVFHWIVWSSGVLYVIGCFVMNSTNITLAQIAPGDFVEGSYGIPRDKDVSDEEWYRYSAAFRRYWYWVLLQPFLSQVLLAKKTHLLPHFYVTYSSAFLLCNIGWPSLAFFVAYFAFFAAARLRNLYVCYLLGFIAIIHSSLPILSLLKVVCCGIFTAAEGKALQVQHFAGDCSMLLRNPSYLVQGSVNAFLMQVGLSWTAARCLSFAVDFVKGNKLEQRQPDLLRTLAYVLYLPSLFTGPLQNHCDFVAELDKPKISWTIREVRNALLQLARCVLYFFLHEAILHFVYSSSLAYYPDLVESLDSPSLLGFGIILTLLFYLKYRVFYGSGAAVAQLERISLPAPPKCVNRIHLCSYLWRHFDRGLYLWIQRYIYRPLIDGQWTLKYRVMGAAASFAFVCSWHGMDRAVIVWCCLNFLGISTELLAGYLCSRPAWRSFQSKYIKGYRLRAVTALVATPHFLFSIFSCLFFLSNVDVGLIFLTKVILGFPTPLLPLLLVMYSGCHVSMDVMDWERHRPA